MMDQLVTWPATPVTSSLRIKRNSESITRLTLSSNVRIVTNSLARDPTHDTFRNAKTVLAKSSPVPSVTTKLIGPNVSGSTRRESMFILSKNNEFSNAFKVNIVQETPELSLF